jgi:hypothetical protein
MVEAEVAMVEAEMAEVAEVAMVEAEVAARAEAEVRWEGSRTCKAQWLDSTDCQHC